jgi:MFS family permease
MRRDLAASSAVMQIAVTLGKLMLGAFMLAGGVAGDVYGRRRVLVLGALGMVGASLLAAVAQTGGMLLAARALDGLASAAIAPMALALIAGAFSQAEQARVIGLFLGLSGLGAALGPLGAGLVVQVQGWRAGFLVPAAVAALGGLGVFVFASGVDAKTEGRRLDGIGALTCAAGLLGLVFGIIQINQVACCIRGCWNPSPLASGPSLPSSGGNAGPGIHYWTSRCFASAPSLLPSRPDYLPHWSWAVPFYRSSISCKPCKR